VSVAKDSGLEVGAIAVSTSVDAGAAGVAWLQPAKTSKIRASSIVCMWLRTLLVHFKNFCFLQTSLAHLYRLLYPELQAAV
jgi:hypothetical protein